MSLTDKSTENLILIYSDIFILFCLRPTRDYLKSLCGLHHTRNNSFPTMELYVNDETSSIKPTEFYAPHNSRTLNSQRKQHNTKETIFDTSDMSKSFNNSKKNIPNEFKNIKMIIGNKQHFNLEKMMKTVNNEQTDDNVIDLDTNIYYASTSSTSCSLHEANDVSTYDDKSFKNSSKHSSYRKSKVMATKPSREFITLIDKEVQQTNLNKCTSTTTRDIEIITYLKREQSMDIRDIDNDEKCNYDSNKRLSLLPNHFRRESVASNSSTRYLISNNNSPILTPSIIPPKNVLECSYSHSSTRSNSILENYTLHSNTMDNDFIEEYPFENPRSNVRNNSRESNLYYKARSKSHAENDKFTQI